MGRGKKGQVVFHRLCFSAVPRGLKNRTWKDDRKWTEDSRPLGRNGGGGFSTSAGAGNNL